MTSCGRGQVVRHQPSKLIFAGPNPVARSKKVHLWNDPQVDFFYPKTIISL